MAKTKRKPRPVVTVSGRNLTTGQVAMLKAAAEATFQGRYVTASDLYRRLEAQIEDGHEADWLRAKMAEITALASLRGEEVEVSEKREHKGRLRILSRDGLERLRDAETISQNQFAAGLRYRDQFEKVEVNLRSCMAGQVAGGGSPGGAADRAADAKRQVREWDDAVFASFPVARDGHDALLAMREIAGRGRSLRDIATSGGRRATLLARLTVALDLVADMLALH